MGRKPDPINSRSGQITRLLATEIADGKWAVDARLPSIRALAARFKTSTFPVRQALDALTEQGYVALRHGSGVYVLNRPAAFRMSDSAMLAMESTGHIHGDLVRLLILRLHDLGLIVYPLDMRHGSAVNMLRRAQHSDSRFLLLSGGGHFHFEALDPARLADKTVIAVLNWQSDLHLDRVHRLLVNQVAGSRLLVEHLWAAGHRRILLAGTSTMLDSAATWDGRGECPPARIGIHGIGLPALWTARGGQFEPLVVHHESREDTAAATARLPALVDMAAPHTAVVGLRDVDAWDVREMLRRTLPHTLPRLALVGNGNTPYSQTSHPPFTTLDWQIEKITDLAIGIVRDVEAGQTFAAPVVHWVPPRLVCRDTPDEP